MQLEGREQAIQKGAPHMSLVRVWSAPGRCGAPRKAPTTTSPSFRAGNPESARYDKTVQISKSQDLYTGFRNKMLISGLRHFARFTSISSTSSIAEGAEPLSRPLGALALLLSTRMLRANTFRWEKQSKIVWRRFFWEISSRRHYFATERLGTFISEKIFKETEGFSCGVP